MDQSPEAAYYAFPLNSANKNLAYAFWKDAFTYEEIKSIKLLGDGLPQKPAEVGGGYEGDRLKDIRDCLVSWVPMNDETRWLYDKMANYIRQLNRDFFSPFDLSGFETMQYTIYKGANAHYDWHVDMYGKTDRPQRKLSVVVQLSDPQEYEGGELWLRGIEKINVPKQAGLLYAFPSWTWHRVTPVTAGVRKSLVAWAIGPEFR